MSKTCNIKKRVIDYEILENKDLKLILTENGKACKDVLQSWVKNRTGKRGKGSYRDFDDKLWEDLEDDGFSVLIPNQFNDLTGAPMMGKDISYDDEGDIDPLDLDQVWFYQYYMTSDPYDILTKFDSVVWAQRDRFAT